MPVTPTLRPWLERSVGESDRYVSHRKKPIGSIPHMWRLTREAAGLDERVTPYSIRHGMARELRKRRVPTEQIKLFLGHLPSGSDATTSIYAPYEPDFLGDAVRAIEDVMAEIRAASAARAHRSTRARSCDPDRAATEATSAQH